MRPQCLFGNRQQQKRTREDGQLRNKVNCAVFILCAHPAAARACHDTGLPPPQKSPHIHNAFLSLSFLYFSTLTKPRFEYFFRRKICTDDFCFLFPPLQGVVNTGKTRSRTELYNRTFIVEKYYAQTIFAIRFSSLFQLITPWQDSSTFSVEIYRYGCTHACIDYGTQPRNCDRRLPSFYYLL